MMMVDLPSPAMLLDSSGGLASSASDRQVEAPSVSLADLAVGDFATIHAVMPSDVEGDREIVMRLIEIGFVPGERVRVIAVGRPGHEPIAVRLSAGESGRRSMSGATFAMRRYEAALIRVTPDRGEAAS